ncbi:hypothetical protein FPQ18DRAFT_375320 [Pyronema domesticum]|uniref:Uncharacterized protein n=1 Tax=Pyronema omphalodes (strain CBS 100304) TaxID=1076935 RepID=U4L5Y1_PYROM|nr:hypothetical protein FPQ18DRAFT_375320 [Pyronema domesticum]CCX12611.1 Protein of unknown function [Pyronema omphalodes CBS 100304]
MKDTAKDPVNNKDTGNNRFTVEKAVVIKHESPGPSLASPPPSPAEETKKFWLVESKPAEESVLGRPSGSVNAAAKNFQTDLSGISRYEKQRFWGWLCDEDGLVDVTETEEHQIHQTATRHSKIGGPAKVREWLA